MRRLMAATFARLERGGTVVAALTPRTPASPTAARGSLEYVLRLTCARATRSDTPRRFGASRPMMGS